MSTDHDPFDLLRDHNPVAVEALPDATGRHGREVLAHVIARSRRLRGRRLRPVLAAAAAVVIVTGATWAVLARSVTEPSGVVCYQSASFAGDRVVVRPQDDATVQVCATPWRNGDLVNPDVPVGSVPPLTGCVNDTGDLAVFPSDDPAVCERLGLASATPSPTGGVAVVIDLQSRLVDYFATSECVSIETAREHIGSVLEELGLTDWQVQAQPAHAGRPCASFGLDADGRVVLLVPVPEP